MNYQQWITDFLNALGAPQTPQNIAFMNAWIAKESGSYPISYGWNPLNTTQTAPGSYGGGAQGNIQFFPNYQSGLGATVQTIKNGYYGDLLNALRGGAPSIGTPYQGLNTWGTGSLAGMAGSAPSSTTGGLRLGGWEWWPGQGESSNSSSSSSSPTWLQNIASIPILGGGAADLVSVGIVELLAVTFFIIGGAWLIFGNQQARTFVTNAGKTAAKAGEAIAA